jgi:hypothetical protein
MASKEFLFSIIIPICLLSALFYQWKKRTKGQELKIFLRTNSPQVLVALAACLVFLLLFNPEQESSRKLPAADQVQNRFIEQERRLQERREYDALQERIWSRQKLACELAPICRDFVRQRQGCATAGNYANCMQIRMGETQFERGRFNCTDDGSFTYISGLREVSASVFQCFPHDISRLTNEVQEFVSKIFR